MDSLPSIHLKIEPVIFKLFQKMEEEVIFPVLFYGVGFTLIPLHQRQNIQYLGSGSGFFVFFFLKLICTLSSGVHVQILQDYCMGTFHGGLLPPSPHHLHQALLPMISLPNLPTSADPPLAHHPATDPSV